ncbi:MAG: LCP family protein [Bacilli bacterium]
MKRKDKKKMKIKKNILSIIFSIITIIFILFIKIVNILPSQYFIIMLIIILAITTIILLLNKKKKKIGYILSIILIIIYLVLSYYLCITKNYFASFSKIHYSEDVYLVLVKKESEYNKIKDLEDKNIGYINSELKDINEVLKKLDKQVTANKIKYSDYDKIFNDLINNNIDAILIEENYYNIKIEEEDTENYKIIYKIKIRNIITSNTKEVDITKNPFTIYISGIDTYGNIETVSRSDVNILITINPLTKQVLLTSIPRDSYVSLSKTTGYKDKLTHAGNYGINMSIDTIRDLLNIDINYYIRVNFTTLEKVIDSLGGIDVYSEYSFISYIDNIQFYKGYNHMNGKEALAFSRERKSLPNGDIDRGKNQEAVIEAIIRKITTKEIIYNYSTILKETKNTFQTNLTDKDITKIIKKELENIGGWNITSNVITGQGKLDYTYSYPTQKLYVMEINNDSLNNAINLIEKVINGEKLDSSYESPSNIQNPNQVIIENKNEDNNTEEEINEDNNSNEEKDPLNDILSNDQEENNTEEEKEDTLNDILPNDEEANNS